METSLEKVVHTACYLWRAEGHHGLTYPFLTWIASETLKIKPDAGLYDRILDVVTNQDIDAIGYYYTGFKCDTIKAAVIYVDAYLLEEYKRKQLTYPPELKPSFKDWLKSFNWRMFGTSLIYTGLEYVYLDLVKDGRKAVENGLFSRRRQVATEYYTPYMWYKPQVSDISFLGLVTSRL